MANNPYVNKVQYGNIVLIDLTADTVAGNKLLSGYTAHDASGAAITGSCTYDADTSDGTTTSGELLFGEIAYSGGQRIVGTMPNIGTQNSTITTKAQQVSISNGYHDGSGKVQIATSEQNKIIPENIKLGVTILGVTGTLDSDLDDGRIG